MRSIAPRIASGSTSWLKSWGLNSRAECSRAVSTQAVRGATEVGYPVLIRPSYVLGGRAMEVVADEATCAAMSSRRCSLPRSIRCWSIVISQGAIEVDVDAISDGDTVVIGGVMEHVEHAGIHSGDSACTLPPRTLDAGDAGRTDAADADAGAGTRRRRSDQCAVRDFRGRNLHPRGQSARLTHHPVRQQGDRRAAGQAGRAGDGRQETRRPRFHRRARARTTFQSRNRCFLSCASRASTPSWAPR